MVRIWIFCARAERNQILLAVSRSVNGLSIRQAICHRGLEDGQVARKKCAFPHYRNATSAKLRNLRLGNSPCRWRLSNSIARMPMRRCWSTRSR